MFETILLLYMEEKHFFFFLYKTESVLLTVFNDFWRFVSDFLKAEQ